MEEITTFVVDVRIRHAESERSVEDVGEIVTYLLSDYASMSRRSLVRVLNLCCFITDRPQMKLSAVEIDLDGCTVPVSSILACVKGVQSFVSSRNYKPKAFFTQGTMDSVRTALTSSRDFML